MCRLITICLIVLFLTSCQQVNNRGSEQENHPNKFKTEPLSYEDNSSSLEKNSSSENQSAAELGYGIPNEAPSQQANSQEIVESSPHSKTLPFEGFVERWNAIASELGSDITISLLQKLENGQYVAMIPNSTSLKLTVAVVNQKIVALEMSGSGVTKAASLQMLTGWSQLSYIMQGEIQPHEIDALFNELGIGPNANLTELNEKTLIQDHISYTVWQSEIGYFFRAEYVND